jgi:hypothetical protein
MPWVVPTRALMSKLTHEHTVGTRVVFVRAFPPPPLPRLPLPVLLCGGAALKYFGSRGTIAPAVVFAYCTWLCWSALTSNPTAGCSPIHYDGTW